MSRWHYTAGGVQAAHCWASSTTRASAPRSLWNSSSCSFTKRSSAFNISSRSTKMPKSSAIRDNSSSITNTPRAALKIERKFSRRNFQFAATNRLVAIARHIWPTPRLPEIMALPNRLQQNITQIKLGQKPDCNPVPFFDRIHFSYKYTAKADWLQMGATRQVGIRHRKQK